jgi:hypothetical protein
MAAADNWAHTGEEDSNTMEESSASEAEDERGKRARTSPVRGPPRAIPDDVLDAVIKLRVTNESGFVSTADGRSKNSRGKIWERISEKLLSDFGDREDVPESALQPRQLGKRWAYIEKNFKVRCRCIVIDLSHSHFHVLIACSGTCLLGKKAELDTRTHLRSQGARMYWSASSSTTMLIAPTLCRHSRTTHSLGLRRRRTHPTHQSACSPKLHPLALPLPNAQLLRWSATVPQAVAK